MRRNILARNSASGAPDGAPDVRRGFATAVHSDMTCAGQAFGVVGHACACARSARGASGARSGLQGWWWAGGACRWDGSKAAYELGVEGLRERRACPALAVACLWSLLASVSWGRRTPGDWGKRDAIRMSRRRTRRARAWDWCSCGSGSGRGAVPWVAGHGVGRARGWGRAGGARAARIPVRKCRAGKACAGTLG